MRETARASIMSFSGGGGKHSNRSTMYTDGSGDESHQPILQHGAPKGSSGLRHYTAEDTSSDYEESEVTHLENRGRF
jgi:hypothetical protein